MKRLAVLAATVIGPALHAGDRDPLPIPEVRPAPQAAPTLPQVPRPQLSGTEIKQGEAGRAEVSLPTMPARPHVRPTVKVQPGTDAGTTGLPARGANGGTNQTPPTPAAPTLPVPPVPDMPAPPAPAPAVVGPECGTNGCATGRRGTWACVKSFLFYHPSKIYFPVTPTPYRAPLLFLCEEKAPCGAAGCGGKGHGGLMHGGPTIMGQAGDSVPGGATTTAPATTGRPGLGSRLFGRSSGKVQPGWATAGETLPGYRLAVPETPAITGQRYPTPPLVGTSYKVPPGDR